MTPVPGKKERKEKRERYMEIVKFKSRCVRDILRTVVITTNAFARMLVVCHGCGAERERDGI